MVMKFLSILASENYQLNECYYLDKSWHNFLMHIILTFANVLTIPITNPRLHFVMVERVINSFDYMKLLG